MESEVHWKIQYKHNDWDWISYGIARTPEATQAALKELREVSSPEYRAIKVTTTHELEDW